MRRHEKNNTLDNGKTARAEARDERWTNNIVQFSFSYHAEPPTSVNRNHQSGLESQVRWGIGAYVLP